MHKESVKEEKKGGKVKQGARKRLFYQWNLTIFKFLPLLPVDINPGIKILGFGSNKYPASYKEVDMYGHHMAYRMTKRYIT